MTGRALTRSLRKAGPQGGRRRFGGGGRQVVRVESRGSRTRRGLHARAPGPEARAGSARASLLARLARGIVRRPARRYGGARGLPIVREEGQAALGEREA